MAANLFDRGDDRTVVSRRLDPRHQAIIHQRPNPRGCGTMTTRISIVEDDAGLCNIVASWLRQSQKLRLLSTFSDGESALAALPAQSPDVVLMDINLPGVDGVECVRQLKPLMPKTQFVMVTVYEDAKRIVSALAAGATGYLLKRATRDELLDAIDEVQGGGSPMTTSIARKVVQHFQQNPSFQPPASAHLAHREQQVLDLITRGYVNKEIADQLQISVPTIKTYIRRIYEKLQVRSRAEAVAKYLRAE